MQRSRNIFWRAPNAPKRAEEAPDYVDALRGGISGDFDLEFTPAARSRRR
ncbi:MAG TPA: hypothetical protein VKU02_13000 [Gemmataceae bacterium]|nr:hypothetical protein [Gemmataceae bacterium]